MRKRNLLLLVSLFSLSSIAGVGCDNNTNTPTPNPAWDWNDDEYGNNVITPTPTNSPVASATPGVDD